MKFSFKIFTFSFLVIIISLTLGGFTLIATTFQRELDLKIEQSIRDNTLLVNFYDNLTLTSNFTNKNYIINQIKNTFNRNEVFIGSINDLKWADKKEIEDTLKVNEQSHKIIKNNNKYYLQVITKAKYTDIIYFENLIDITNLYTTRDNNYQSYYYTIIIITIISSSITILFAIHITKPLKKLQALTLEISNGNYQARIKNPKRTMKSPEFIILANSFNEMTKKIETYTNELKDYSKRQEQFVASFSHELKTPLTSIIGYADYLRTYTSHENQELINYIYKEGKRLEELSLHLLDLNLLKNENIILQKINTKALAKEVFYSLNPLEEKYHTKIDINLEECFILAEPSLIKSLIYNLVDNACKASSKQIIIKGTVVNSGYNLEVIDNGKGIPESSLKKVTEPFYMVDKSRARKQGGSGLGLSIVNSIASLHQTKLKIKSRVGVGTTMSIELEVYHD